MKELFRKILFVKSTLYLYPYSITNLDEDLKRIFEANYFNNSTALRGKIIGENQFSLWEKWNFFRGRKSQDALAYFSGSKFIQNNKTYIIGTIYPHPFTVLGFYLTCIIFLLSLLQQNDTGFSLGNIDILLPIGSIGVALISIILYFRWSIQTKVEIELDITKTHHNKS
ncbi:hypothetical protein [Marinifilum fragile]|uniref:hypothetical protein n=1 Tax=Marinifilum fragile TaxID=570161 RepID=UPI002AA63D13|nr:hypothetical protein [Marinifilum fragile]